MDVTSRCLSIMQCRCLGLLFLVVCVCSRPTDATDTVFSPFIDPIGDGIGQWQQFDAWTDEFNGDAGLAPSSAKWWRTNPDWLGRQPGLFVEGNVALSGDGSLLLSARPANISDPALVAKGYANYSTAAVRSKTASLYGLIEVNSTAGSSTISSSFWLYRPTDTAWTEIDVNELCGSDRGSPFMFDYSMTTHVLRWPNATSCTELLPLCGCQKCGTSPQFDCSNHQVWKAAEPFSRAPHIYSFLWNETQLEWYVDRDLKWSIPNRCHHEPLWLNFDRETMPTWFGVPPVSTLPDHPFTIDYVRTWKRVAVK